MEGRSCVAMEQRGARPVEHGGGIVGVCVCVCDTQRGARPGEHGETIVGMCVCVCVCDI